ncbi:hypothetical protein [Cupriavidus sp. MP-37]|uniref:hypothetical protein n=1 Tax=Cupriavidus sp. MP-37 TaxID=2884455 RepID=UPI00351CF917
MSATRKRFDADPYPGHCSATVVAASAEGIGLDQTVRIGAVAVTRIEKKSRANRRMAVAFA